MSAEPASTATSTPVAEKVITDVDGDDLEEEKTNGGKELTAEELAVRAAKKKQRKLAAAKRKKEEAKQQQQQQSATAVTNASGTHAAVEAATDALESSFSSLSMHSYFNDASNGTHMKFTRSRGRHVVATRVIPAGTPVFRIAPYAAVVSDEMVQAYCTHCHKTAATMQCCSACKHARYCSNKCRHADAYIHSLECAALSRIHDVQWPCSTQHLRMLIRISYLILEEKKANKKKDGKQAASSSSSSSTHSSAALAKLKPQWLPKPGCSSADLKSLITHEESYSTEDKDSIKMIVNKLQQSVIQDAELWHTEELSIEACMRIMLQISCNAHTIQDENKTRTGVGLFIPAAYLNHSCSPSCVYWFDEEGQMVMQSIRQINVGEEITYSYTDLYSSRATRADVLKRVFFIDSCQCERCLKTQEKSSSDALMRMMVCSATDVNPMCTWRTNALTGQQTDTNHKLALLKYDKSNTNMHSTNDNGRTYTKAAIDELIANTASLCEQAMLMVGSQDFDDALECIEQRILYATKPHSPSHPFFHPYHASLFAAYLRLIGILDGAPSTIANRKLSVRYASACIECLEVQQLTSHPEMADILALRARAYEVLGEKIREAKLIGSDEDITVYDVPRMVAKEPTSNTSAKKAANESSSSSSVASVFADVTALNISASSSSTLVDASSSASSSSTSLPQISLLPAAYLDYRRAADIRLICYGAAHKLTKSAVKSADALKKVYDEHAGVKETPAIDFDEVETQQKKGKGKGKNKK